jgi:hypothetical protein
MPASRRQRRTSIGEHHAEWLSLVQTSGPFLTVPTLEKVLPDGLDAAGDLADVRVAYSEWRDDESLTERWVRWVLDELLGLRDATGEATDLDPSHRIAEHGVTLRASYVVRDRSEDGAPVVLLVHRYPPGTPLDRPLRGEAWAASPLDRAAELARATELPLALVTDGQRWTLVWARQGESTGSCTWRAELWLEEPVTLRAFVTLLGARRFFALPLEQGLAALLADSAGRQQEVADQLGAQVRHAVELLIATLDREDTERHGELLANLEGAEAYRGAVAVMMRLVFLFVAEERRLLPLDDQRYAETLAASTLRAQLQERADRDGEDPLERSTAAWHRVLALFRAVHGGIEHDALRLPAYGGGLFDPDRYPFLEGRGPGSRWHDQPAQPLPVDDRTMLHLLDALQTLAQGGARVLLSYEALDVEQIGHVYEGLLDHTAVRISDTSLALSGKHEPELPLRQVEAWAEAGEDTLVEQLAKETGRSASAIRKALATELADELRSRLRAACGADDSLLDRVAPFHALLREDLRGHPLVFLPGSLYVTQALDRRASGTYYTPRELAEEVVRHTLDPIVYDPGPAQEADPAKWKLRSAHTLLELKVCDIAMGSGAFLVAACRYLAARLLEAWSTDMPAAADYDRPTVTYPPVAVPADPLEREALAHRLVAERCLYGVDKNPMAVEMAKVSLWLITLAKDRPFSFVDHALRAGDSLLGVTDLQQLRSAHVDPSRPRQSSVELGFHEIEVAVDRALTLRRELEAFVVRDLPDGDRKAALLGEAEAALADARLLGDLVVGAALAGLEDADPLVGGIEVSGWLQLTFDHEASELHRVAARAQLRTLADGWLVERRAAVGETETVEWSDRHPFHWALEFPEVWERGGFDAIVGNPPFQHGQKLTGSFGERYREFLVGRIAHQRGSADLVVYFVHRAVRLVRPGGELGLLTTNTIAEGDTRQVGLDQLLTGPVTVRRAVRSTPWPGGATLSIAKLWLTTGEWSGDVILDGDAVGSIDSALRAASRVTGEALRLQRLSGRAFRGTIVLGMGFTLTPAEAERLVAEHPVNAEVLFPYLSAEDIMRDPRQAPSRWVINFFDWAVDRAEQYPDCFERVRRLVRPDRERARGKNAIANARADNWWQFASYTKSLYAAIRGLERVLAIPNTSKHAVPIFVPSGPIFSNSLIIAATDSDQAFGVLTSGFHWWWAATMASTMRTDIRYSPTDCFETFPQPDPTDATGMLGAHLNEHRSALMLDRQEGLTRTYNRVHDPGEHSDDIARLREIHVKLDYAVRDAYGWSDLDLGHGFHDTKFGVRFTLAPGLRQEVLDRLLELNHERYSEEVQQGLHAKPKAKRKAKSAPAGALTFGFDGV